jgi:Protein of unknown function (DUF3467)
MDEGVVGPEGQRPESFQPEIAVPPDQLGGVWANFARVTHSEHEFTLDFVRMDYSEGSPPRRGVVVARVGFSPLFVLQLVEALNRNWARYAERAMPKEVGGSGGVQGGAAPDPPGGDPSAGP